MPIMSAAELRVLLLAEACGELGCEVMSTHGHIRSPMHVTWGSAAVFSGNVQHVCPPDCLTAVLSTGLYRPSSRGIAAWGRAASGKGSAEDSYKAAKRRLAAGTEAREHGLATMFSVHFSHLFSPTRQQMVCDRAESRLHFQPVSCEVVAAKDLDRDASAANEQADRRADFDHDIKMLQSGRSCPRPRGRRFKPLIGKSALYVTLTPKRPSDRHLQHFGGWDLGVQEI